MATAEEAREEIRRAIDAGLAVDDEEAATLRRRRADERRARQARQPAINGELVDPWTGTKIANTWDNDPHQDAAASFDDQYLSVDQLDDLPTPEPLIEGVLNRHSYGLLIGRDGTYKTFTMLDWACCLASGKPWQSRTVTQSKVLYVAAEGAYGIARRVAAWRDAWHTEIPAEMLTFRRSSVNLFKPGAAFTDLLERIEAGAYEVVFLDTLRRMSGGADGNGSDMGVVVDNIDRLKRATANGSVFSAAHTDKGDNDTRGFSGIEDDADIVWHSKADGDDGDDITVKNTKMKDGPSGEVIRLRPHRVGDSLVVVARHIEAASSPAAQTAADNRVMTAMSETFALTGASRDDITEATGLSRSTFYEARSRLLKDGRIVIRSYRIYLPSPDAVSDESRNSNAVRQVEDVA